MLDPTDPDLQQAMEKMAKAFTVLAVRNTYLEDLHAGVVPHSETVDGSDIMVTDASGREIPWAEVSRFNDAEMKVLMKQVVDRLYTCLLHMFDPAMQPTLDHALRFTQAWDPAQVANSLLPGTPKAK